MLPAPIDERHFAFDGHGICDEAAARFQVGPAGGKYIGVGDAPADEDRVGSRQFGEGCRRFAANKMKVRHAQRAAIVQNELLPLVVGFDCERPAHRVAAHPLDADRTAACSDIPQQFAGKRGEMRERHGTDITFGQLSVMFERVIRQTGQQWKGSRFLADHAAIDGHDIEIRTSRMIPGAGNAINPALNRSAEMFEHCQPGASKSALGEHSRHIGRCIAVIAEDDEFGVGNKGFEQRLDWPAMNAQQLAFLNGPAHCSGCERERGRGRKYSHLAALDMACQRRAHAEMHRVAAGEHHDGVTA